MGGERKRILVALVLVFVFGFAVYLKLWSIDYAMSSDEAEILRRQFDLANREAMDESAEWRRLYDNELDRAYKCYRELNETKKSFEKKVEDAARIIANLTKLREENIALREQVDALKRKHPKRILALIHKVSLCYLQRKLLLDYGGDSVIFTRPFSSHCFFLYTKLSGKHALTIEFKVFADSHI